MTVPLRAALYLRVSTARQAEHDVSIVIGSSVLAAFGQFLDLTAVGALARWRVGALA